VLERDALPGSSCIEGNGSGQTLRSCVDLIKITEDDLPVEWTMSTSGSDEVTSYGNGSQWQDTIHLLRLVQSDYQGVRKQLETVSHTLAEREALVGQRLQHALLACEGFRTLCLIQYAAGSTGSRMGKAILGGATPLSVLPGPLRLEVRCFGRFEVSSGWQRIERWQSAKAKSVFQYLMSRPREPVIKDVLMETLWPGCDPQAAGNNLKAAMHVLRQTIGRLFDKKENSPYVLFVQGSYLTNPEIELWVDVDEFEQHWMLGRRLEREGRVTEAIREFELAEALYRGDYLEDEPYEEWTLLRREALKDTYVIILGKLAEYCMKTADYESRIMYCQKILAKDPCREDAYRWLMRCYSRLGQRNHALHWYEICRRTIQAELDAAPDQETTALYHALLRDEHI
jgi:DNA-binding SARP family transcriptional activator